MINPLTILTSKLGLDVPSGLKLILITGLLGLNTSVAQEIKMAADLYRKAHAQLVESGFTDMAKRYEAENGGAWYATIDLDNPLKQKLESMSNAAAVVRQAAQLPLGGWHGEKDPQRLAQIKSMSRDLLALMTLQARMDVLNGKPMDAADDLLSCMSYSNHVGQDGVMITKLVEIAVSQIVSKALARQIPELPESTLQSMSSKIKQLPPTSSPKEVFRNERDYALQLMKDQKEIYSTDMIRSFRVFYDDLIQLVDESDGDFEDQLKGLGTKYSKQPLIKSTLPMFGNVWSKMEVIEVHRALILSGINLVLEGESALGRIPDPHGGKPFTYLKTDKGFTLTSQLEIRSDPISLHFGH